MSKENNVRIQDLYRFGRKLRDDFGPTYECQDRHTGELACCKTISKITADIDEIKREIAIMEHLEGHEDIVSIYGIYEDITYVYIVMELCRGGDLCDKILERMKKNDRVPFREREVASILKSIVQVIQRCHALGVIHRDIKLESFLLKTRDDTEVLKATNFGLSTFFRPGQGFNRFCGSPLYMAPEIVRWRPGGWKLSRPPPMYGPEVDIWSAGVILYTLLSGFHPFFVRNGSVHDIYKAILTGTPTYSVTPWKTISKEATHLVQWMLNPDPKGRPTAHQVLAHPWVCEPGMTPEKPLEPVVVTRLKEFTSMCKLKKIAIQVIAKSLKFEEFAGLQEIFKTIDVDESGTISFHELKEWCAKLGAMLSDSELEAIMKEVDIDQNGVLEFPEFLAATLNVSKIQKEENLHCAFASFDMDSSGTISKDELLVACQQLNMNEDDVAQMIKEVDKNNDGVVDYQEFVAMMKTSTPEKGH